MTLTGGTTILTVGRLVLMTLCLTVPITAQTITVEELYTRPGKLVAAGVDEQASGPLKIKSFKFEEVHRPLQLGTTVIKSYMRLTVTLETPVNGGYIVFVNDESQIAVKTQRNAVSAIFSAGEVDDGAQISVALGSRCGPRLLSTMKTKLRLPEQYRLTARGDADRGCRVKKIRFVPAQAGLRDRDEVEFQLTMPERFPVMNEVVVMQIGNVEVAGDGYGYGVENALLFRMSLEQFSRAEEGKRIKVKFGFCSGGGLRFGRLNKAQLEQ
ncbi:MAG TPA: hypothetical protein VFH31_07770 [Pyrinomonadaceae bacterium]|nr:hypothetical protein [Pyrinomonadaceae bacterium]